MKAILVVLGVILSLLIIVAVFVYRIFRSMTIPAVLYEE